MAQKPYGSLYERIVASTTLLVPDNPQSCWVGKPHNGTRGYAYITLRVNGKTKGFRGCRLMLEEIHQIDFPHDQAGHLCCNPACLHPDHLEVQTLAFNLSQRRGYAPCKGPHLPTLYPREDTLQLIADFNWDNPGTPSHECPF